MSEENDEQKAKGEEDKKQETPKDSFRERNKQERLDLIKSENEVAERLEAANKVREEHLNRVEALADTKQLSGDSDAGKPSKPVEETPKEYRDRIMKGE